LNFRCKFTDCKINIKFRILHFTLFRCGIITQTTIIPRRQYVSPVHVCRSKTTAKYCSLGTLSR
jgi:hypothetical protein